MKCKTTDTAVTYDSDNSNKIRLDIMYSDYYDPEDSAWVEETKALFKKAVFMFSISGWQYSSTAETESTSTSAPTLSFTIESKW